jgi:hypothetical protein
MKNGESNDGMAQQPPSESSPTLDGPSLGSISFDVEGWICIQPGQDKTIRCWETQDGDRIALTLNRGADAFPPGLSSLADLREHWNERLWHMQGSVIEATEYSLTGGPVYSIVHKMRQQPRGFSYTATILIPFDGFGFMLVVRCPEQDMTGLREAIAVDQSLQGKNLSREQIQALVGSVDADHEVRDEEIPDHPLSRLHRLLDRVLRSIVISPEVLALPRPNPLPESSQL